MSKKDEKNSTLPPEDLELEGEEESKEKIKEDKKEKTGANTKATKTDEKDEKIKKLEEQVEGLAKLFGGIVSGGLKMESPKDIKSDLALGKELKTDSQRVKDALDKQEKVKMFVPLGFGEKRHPKNYIPVSINGYRFEIKKGHWHILPEQVAKMLEVRLQMSVPSDSPEAQEYLVKNKDENDAKFLTR